VSLPITDHVGMWADEISAWLPAAIFDAHVHLGLPDAVGPIAPARRQAALLTFTSLPWGSFTEIYAQLFPGRTLTGVFALPFPQREVALDAANDYLIDLMAREPRAQGFLLSDPRDPAPAIAAFARARQAGVRIRGVKPYADRLGKGNFEATMAEFLPDGLLEFMNEHGLIMLLHTAGQGVGERECQDFLRRLAQRWPRVRVVLAHMGRYVHPRQFLDFLAAGVLEECPGLYLEMSSASVVEVYESTLRHEWLWPRLLFGSDLPFGLITGVEHWSATHGAIFLTRDTYPWSDPAMDAAFAEERKLLTYNTYHTIKALKDALYRLGITGAQAAALKALIFERNAQRLLAEAQDPQAADTPAPGRRSAAQGVPHATDRT
jgi:predicted TIM-barrel fold metal-dependent hydrolase